MYLDDLFDRTELMQALQEGLVTRRTNAEGSLAILNYSPRCQHEPGLWNAVTLQCRGLIYDMTGRVIARPFPKFFNHQEAMAPTIPADHPVTVTDKLDGSLGILYRDEDTWRIATRGSFESDQARHATWVLQQRYYAYRPPPGWTVLVEIVYPANRIVLDYGAQDDLILLGAVEIASGVSIAPTDPLLAHWTGPRAAVFAYDSLADALAAPPRANAEGLVVHDILTGDRVKIKQADYVELHKLICGLNEQVVWRSLTEHGSDISRLLEATPEEFHPWIVGVADNLLAEAWRIRAAVVKAYDDIAWSGTRKEFAERARRYPDLMRWLFMLCDDRDPLESILKSLKPAATGRPGGRPPLEDAA